MNRKNTSNKQFPSSETTQLKSILVICCCLLMSACAFLKPREPGIGQAIQWKEVNGWENDRHAEAWPALVRNCIVLSSKTEWGDICAAMQILADPTDIQARNFFEKWFIPHHLFGKGGNEEGLITGYYEPLLKGSLAPSDSYRYPLYRSPPSLLTIDLGDMYPELKNKRVRGRIQANKVVPFYSRQEIEENRKLLEGNEIVWINDRDDVFFLHIQGSGRVQFEDGSSMGVGYSNQNGHPYVAIGRLLLEWEELEREEISLFSIKQWLRDYPEKAVDLLNANPSYVFFTLREDNVEGPIGSLNVPLTPQRSIAIDPKVVPLGTPVWLTTNSPGDIESLYQRLVIAQDTGGAIRGPVRGDLFWGHGSLAEQSAGIMKEKGSMLVLLPKLGAVNQ